MKLPPMPPRPIYTPEPGDTPDDVIAALETEVAWLDKQLKDLVFVAEDVLTRWAIIRVSEGKLGSMGLPDALRDLELRVEALSPEDDDGTPPTDGA